MRANRLLSGVDKDGIFWVVWRDGQGAGKYYIDVR
jgi:hypothetical protein